MKRMIVLFALVFSSFPAAAQNNINGLGHSTLTCIDVDGDGYGVGATCAGPDADDFDATVQTAAQGIAKYGSLTAFIAHLGYATTGNFWCLSPTGSDGSGAANSNAATACTRPFQHFSATSPVPGDILLMRANYNDSIFPPAGTSTASIVFLAYPGESPVFDTATVGNAGFRLTNHDTVDGVILQTQADIKCSTDIGASSSNCTGLVTRHVEGRATVGSTGLGPISGFNDLVNWVIEYSVLHDDSSQHGVYIGSNDLPSSGVIIRKSIAYNNVRNGFTFNGRCTACIFDQLISYNNGIAGLTLEMGVSNSFIRSNLFFSNGGTQFTIYNYNDNCPNICPYDQTGNLIENNTIYHTGNDYTTGGVTGSGCPAGISDCSGDAIRVANLNTSASPGNLGNNTFRNNILVNYGYSNIYAPIAYEDSSTTCGSACMGWLSSSTWTGIIAMQADGKNGTGVFRTGSTISTCAQAASLTTLSGCQNANPQFVSAAISYWNSVGSFDFRLLPSSPALHTGTSTGQPNYDLAGRVYTTSTPSMGSRERNLFAQGWNSYPGLVNSLCPATGASGSVDGSGNPYNYQYYCTAGITVPWSGAFDVTNPLSPGLCPWGGGHDDYGGNEIYCFNFNLASPSTTRISNPSYISKYDFTAGGTAYPDSAPNTLCVLGVNCTAPQPGHSEHVMDYSPSLNKAFLFDVGGYGTSPPPVGGTSNAWALDWSTSPPTWSYLAPNCNSSCGTNIGGAINPPSYWTGAAIAYAVGVWDSNRNVFWVNQGLSGAWATLDPATNIFTLRTTGSSTIVPSYQNNQIFDSKRNLIYFVGGGGSAGGQFEALDTSIGGTASITDYSKIVNSSCSAVLGSIAPGLGYDSLRDVLYTWPTNGQGTIYVMSLANFPNSVTCTPLTTGTGPGVSATTLGTWGRLMYYSGLDALVLVPGFNEGAFVYSLPPADPGGAGPSAPAPAPPVVSMTAPGSGATVSGTVTVSASATSGVGISSVQLLLDGNALGGSLSTSPFSVSWNTTTAMNGTHTLSALATDISGNTATAAAVTVTVSNATSGVTAPVVSMTAPANGATVSATVTVSASATSSVGLGSVQFLLDGSALGGSLSASPFSVSWNTTSTANGIHTLAAVAKDIQGNSTSATAISVTVSNSAPLPPMPGGGNSANTGLGNSTLTCIDVDGDGYGVGATCIGPDADDLDAGVQTAAQGITKYGSLNAFIAHLGYSTSGKFWCLSPTGNDTTGAPSSNASTACASPFQHFSAISMAAGDIALMRANYNDSITTVAGTSGAPYIFLAYPGESPVFDTATVGNAGFRLTNYNTVDGVILQTQADIKCSTDHMAASSNCTSILTRHVEGRGSVGSTGLGPISGFNDLQNWTIEYSVLHDDTSQHGVYLGSDELASSGVIMRNSIAYNNSRNGFTFNGRCTGCIFEQLVSYNNGLVGLTWEMGVSNSIAQNNLFFSNGTNQMVIYNYDGDSCTSAPYICPFDQTGNLIENNTMFATGNDEPDGIGTGSGCPSGITECGSMGITVTNSRMDEAGNLGGNTYRNNIIAAYGYSNIYAAIQYIQTANTCNSTCQAWAASDTWVNNLAFQADGLGGSSAPSYRIGNTNYTCAAAAAIVGTSATFSGCQNANPGFVAASISYWNSVHSFDFRLQTSSPGIQAGVSAGATTYDLTGVPFGNPPSLGSREVSTVATSCDLNADGVVNVLDVQLGVDQSLGTVACTGANLTGSGHCSVIDVQRLQTAALGGACILGN